MGRVIIAVHLKRSILIFLIFIAFLVLLPLLIVGVGSNPVSKGSNTGIDGFNIKPNDIVFNSSNGGGPTVKVYITADKKIKEMSLEEYVRGVVSAEIPATFEKEAMKAQAVAVRTFALSRMTAYGGNKCSQGNGADLCDTTHCQVYMDKDKRLTSWSESLRGEYWNKITEAVQETAGQVITYNGQMVKDAMYFAVSGGKTEDVVDVFASNEPYLKSVSSPNEKNAPKYQSSLKIKNITLASNINSAYPNAAVTASKLKNQLLILSRTTGGSVKDIKIGNVTITGVKFRSLLGLNSANFQFKFGSTETEIICTGYGHGVGMSQWGANAMAKNGQNYNEILTHYYTGVKVEKMTGK